MKYPSEDIPISSSSILQVSFDKEEEENNVVIKPISEDPEPQAPAPQSKYSPLEFLDSAEMLAFFTPAILDGTTVLHKWQIEVAKFLAASDYSKENPLKFILCACNGSGKDAYVIAPFAVFHALTKIRSRCIITSSSFNQLQSQTEAYIRALAGRINEKMAPMLGGQLVFNVKQMHITCNLTGSEIKMFSTDEPGRAEGFHPFPDHPGAELCIIVNESKTVPDAMFEALQRCTFNRWLEVSSPGKTSGHMFENYKRSLVWPEKYENSRWYSRKISAYDCPHISRTRVEDEKEQYGEHHPWFRSARLAEFTSLDEQVVITSDAIRKMELVDPEPVHGKLRAGLDLAAGGDENALYVIRGNEVIGSEIFRADDTSVTVNAVIDFLRKYGFKQEDASNVFADHGGVGASYAGHFREKGWEFSWILNQSAPLRKLQYGNRGAEMWFQFARLIESCCIVLPKDDTKLIHQLTSRYYTQHKSSGRIILEAKREARAKGHGSPDRADALVLAFTGLTVDDFLGVPKRKKSVKSHFVSQDELVEMMDTKKFSKQTPSIFGANRVLGPDGRIRTLTSSGPAKRPANTACNIIRSYGQSRHC